MFVVSVTKMKQRPVEFRMMHWHKRMTQVCTCSNSQLSALFKAHKPCDTRWQTSTVYAFHKCGQNCCCEWPVFLSQSVIKLKKSDLVVLYKTLHCLESFGCDNVLPSMWTVQIPQVKVTRSAFCILSNALQCLTGSHTETSYLMRMSISCNSKLWSSEWWDVKVEIPADEHNLEIVGKPRIMSTIRVAHLVLIILSENQLIKAYY